jgi:hypothetical protein
VFTYTVPARVPARDPMPHARNPATAAPKMTPLAIASASLFALERQRQARVRKISRAMRVALRRRTRSA